MSSNKRPNIILINIDDLGYGDLGCYGSKINKTPAIDRLAKEGMLFTDFYAPASICTPSRAGMLTGSYPKRISFDNFKIFDRDDRKEPFVDFFVLMAGQPEGLHPKEKTLAHILKGAGYRTKMIGKWHVGDQEEFLPHHFGFDDYLGVPYSNDLGLMKKTKELGARTNCPLPVLKNGTVIQEQPNLVSLSEWFTSEAVEFIKEDKNEPFFLYFAHFYVHNPLFVHEKFMKEANGNLMTGAVASLDWTVDTIVSELEREGLAENTLIIFTSDNGGNSRSSNAPLKGHKSTVWEGGFRVPCIMKWPETIKKNLVCHTVCSMLDFFPTFEDISGYFIEDGLMRDGESMLTLLKGEENREERPFFYYFRDMLKCVRYGDFKLHLDTRELYNLKEDMGDKLRDIPGKNCRPKGYVEGFKALTVYDKYYPYMVALYDGEWQVHKEPEA